jgi:solute carrier family 25 (mitochondrial oxoglutarate transporter), member 11
LFLLVSDRFQLIMSSSTTSKPTPSAAAPKQLGALANFATAGFGGVFGWIIVHPFNTVAVRMSLASMNSANVGKQLSFPAYFAKTVRENGIMTVYNGLGAGILRQVFYASSRFGLFEVFRDEYVKRNGSVDLLGRLGCGVVSGSIAAFISCPAEVTLVRISNDSTLPPDQRRNYSSVPNAFTRILKEEGFSAFFRGSGPFVNRAMLVGAVQVGTYDQFKQTYREKFHITDPIQNVFCAAMTSGLLYALITMPFETCKNRMAFQKVDPATGKLPFTSTPQAIKKIISEEGLLTLWRGFSPYYLRCGGHTVSMFMAIQWIRAKM